MNDKTVLKRNPDFVTRVIEDETILLPVCRTSEEINCIYTLNPSAAKAWNMFDGKRSVGQVRERIVREFETTPAEARTGLAGLLKDLAGIKALVEAR